MKSRHGYLRPALRLKWVLTIGSMILSGLFGYLAAEGVPVLNVILAAIFASFAYGLAWAVEQRAYCEVLGDSAQSRALLLMAILCGTLNMVADYSSSTAVREIVSTRLGDINRVTNDKVGEVKRLSTAIEDIKGQVAWKTSYDAPDTYRADIANLEGDQTIMKRSKGCTDQTLPDTKAHCQKISNAKAHLAMAEQRAKLDHELASLSTQLAEAKKASASVETHANSNAAATRAFVSWGLLTRNLSEDNMVWGQNTILLLTTIVLVVMITVLSHIIGTIEGRIYLEVHGDDGFTLTAPRLARPDHVPAAAIPLKAQAAPPHHDTTNYVVINGKAQPHSTQTDQLIAMATAALARYEKSPFAKTEGQA